MHEFSITQDLLERAISIANARQIVRVNLSIGPFSEEREESIEFYWKDLAKGSLGEGAELHFEQLPVQIRCLDCTGAYYLEDETSMCEFCSNESLQLSKGEDVRLESIEVK
ncbi:MAG TPA: hydrogenase maturation nickel metallochaperone HypA [Anaerolineales bacterium]